MHAESAPTQLSDGPRPNHLTQIRVAGDLTMMNPVQPDNLSQNMSVSRIALAPDVESSAQASPMNSTH